MINKIIDIFIDDESKFCICYNYGAFGLGIRVSKLVKINNHYWNDLNCDVIYYSDYIETESFSENLAKRIQTLYPKINLNIIENVINTVIKLNKALIIL